jgi:hypothetical protein
VAANGGSHRPALQSRADKDNTGNWLFTSEESEPQNLKHDAHVTRFFGATHVTANGLLVSAETSTPLSLHRRFMLRLHCSKLLKLT